MKLLRSMHKQLHVLLHHRLTTAVIILGPIVLLIAASIAFSGDGLHGIKVGWVGSQDDAFSDRFHDGIESAGYALVPFTTAANCEDALKRSQVHMCTSVLPEQQTVRFHVDAARVNLVWTLLNSVQASISSAQDDYRYELTTTLLSSVSRLNDGVRMTSSALDNLSRSLESTGREVSRLEQEASAGVSEPPSLDVPDVGVDGRGILSMIEENQRAVNDAQRVLDDAQSDLAGSEEEFLEQERSLLAVFQENGCSEATSTDYRTDEPDDWEAEMADGQQFICNVLYTQLMTVRACHEPLAKIDSRMASFERELDDTEDSLDDAEDQAEDLISTSEQQQADLLVSAEAAASQQDAAFADIRQRQKDLQGSLQELSAFIANGSSQTGALADALDDLSAESMRLRNRSADDFVNPVVVSTEGLDSERTPMDYLFGPFLLFIAMFVSVLLAAVLVVRERSSRAFQRILLSPSSPYLVLVSTFLTTVLVSFTQVIILAFVGRFALGLSVDLSLSVILVLLLACSVFVLLGMLLGVLLPSVETAITIAVLAGLSMIFFSNTLVPIESIPVAFQQVAGLNPLLFFSQALTKGLLHGMSLLSMLLELALALSMAACLCVLLWMSYSWLIRRVLSA